MNNTFSPRRFGWLLKKTLLERPAQMFGFTGLILALSLITYAVCKTFIWYNAAQNMTFIWGLAAGGGFMASFVFAYFSSGASGSSYLTLPVSNVERWLCGMVIAVVLYPLVFLLFFRLMDTMFVTLYHNSLDPTKPFYKAKYESVFLFPLTGLVAGRVYPIFLVLTGAMLLGPLYFNKIGFIKTALVIAALVLVGFGINWLFAQMFFGHINDAAPFNHVTLQLGREEGSIELPDATGKVYNFCLVYVLPLILCGLVYIRLREKEF
jgi:hypothetical protein